MNPRMQWERGSAIYFFTRCKRQTHLVLWSHFYTKKKDANDFTPKWNVHFGRGEMSYVKTSVNYISFFSLPTSSCNIHPNRLEWTSHSGQNSFASVSCSIDVSSFHTQDFCSHSAFTNLRYRRIQEHVVILLSNNCAVFVVHFWPVFDITSMPWQEDLI